MVDWEKVRNTHKWFRDVVAEQEGAEVTKKEEEKEVDQGSLFDESIHDKG